MDLAYCGILERIFRHPTDDGSVVRMNNGTVQGSVIAVTIAITDHDQCFFSHDPRLEAVAH